MERRRIVLVALGLFGLAVALRFYGLGWGLPAVYEEAYPFKKSWDMWGWGPKPPDLNPHFFNYPSFYFYVQFLGQGVLYLFLKLQGVVDSTLDYRVLYALDKTPFYLLGRSITALCGAATVLVTFAIGRRIGGSAVAVLAAGLVAVNQTHIEKSQVIEVDVPMTLLSLLCCFFALRILDGKRRRDYLLAALCGGLATSTKYNGALLALPIFVAHLIATARPATTPQPPGRRPPAGAPTAAPANAAAWRSLGLAAVLFALVFFATSPYVLLDQENFWIGFNYEREHMRLGHFGLDDTPTPLWYLRVMTGSLLGWPLMLLATAGVVFQLVRRRPWAVILAVFPAVYLLLISLFAMKAERYVLPLLPVATLFAAAFAVEALRRWLPVRPALRAAALATLALAMAVPSFVAYAHGLDRLRGDTRTLAREWIEANLPKGSFLVTESYGPEPIGAIDIANLEADVRQRIQDERPDTKVYAIFQMPMYQVRPENTALFYDLRLYEESADLIVVSGSVRSRYRQKPETFEAQNAFYDSLEARWTKVRELGPEDGSGPRLALYANPRVTPPFSKRQAAPLPLPPVVPDLIPGSFSMSFERLAFLYEAYGFNAVASVIYQMGLRYPDQPFEGRRSLGVGAVRTSLKAKRNTQALAILDALQEAALDPNEAAYWRKVRSQITTPAPASRDSSDASGSEADAPATGASRP